MKWIPLQSVGQLQEVMAQSQYETVLLFKHSTRCSISTTALERINRSTLSDQVPSYLLDLLLHRDVSAAIADRLNVHHESPQVLLIKSGQCFYDESHLAITVESIQDELKKM